MAITRSEFTKMIKDFNIKELFNCLGWDNDKTTQPIVIDDDIYQIQSIAEKSGFRIILCPPMKNGNIPEYSVRKKIDNAVTKLFQEHMIIFHNGAKTEQIWIYTTKAPNKPAKLNQIPYDSSQSPELLFQKTAGLYFELDEEDNNTIVDVNRKFNKSFGVNSEKITKKFYEGFKKIHTAFIGFTEGIDDKLNKDWYASLMLNRLMFCYFIQKKRFLDNNANYLRDKLNECQNKKGIDKFYTFYKSFLIKLFHKGLGDIKRDKEIVDEIGNIPYLNGGLFDVHEIEENYEEISIPDGAFTKIFDFFDQYEWHLDTRKKASGNEINPDVIGYIFEKYINDRAQMGAYYTQEDITEYISKNCILPFLIEETKKKHPHVFDNNSFIWTLLKESNDKYIFDSVKHGIEFSLPEEIEVSVDTSEPGLIERRKEWNKAAPIEFALPTETWREVLERRKRYFDIKSKIDNGEISDINDFITYNINIRQFVQDVIETIDDPDFIRIFYIILKDMTILDPTCGSGAFLFAALNVLEPIYEACIMRMRQYIQESDRPRKHKTFERIIDEIEEETHPSEQYYIYKSIILRNLYGVDLMKEAVETAKLRLFLKLVSTVVPDYTKNNMGLEPLPDIDFNIKSGNSLVGFATKNELDYALVGDIYAWDMQSEILNKCIDVERAINRYKDSQLSYGFEFEDFKLAKRDLNTKQKVLNEILDKLYYKKNGQGTFESWKEKSQPFHWYSEFYEIMNKNNEIMNVNGGFDVIIGNPPYVEFKDIDYTIPNIYTSFDSKSIHAICIERSLNIINSKGSCGMIVPVSICASDGFMSIRKYMRSKMNTMFFSHYSMRPSKLFDEVEKHLTIFLLQSSGEKKVLSSKYHRWYSVERENLFGLIRYTSVEGEIFHNDSIPKIGVKIETEILRKIKKHHAIYLSTLKNTTHKVYHTRKLRYFLQFLDQAPKIYEEDGTLRVTSELKKICFSSEQDKHTALSVFLSSLFFWYYITYSDCRNLNKREVDTFPLTFSNISSIQKDVLVNYGNLIMNNLQKNSYYSEANYRKYGKLKMQVFRPRLSKEIVDKIDSVLASIYGFTEEEFDFITNYDIKFRMGVEGDEVDE